jgi:hypothetical protein
MNRVRTNLVRVAPSKLIHGEAGLFSCEDIEEGTVVACFGAVRQLREGEEGTRTSSSYWTVYKKFASQSQRKYEYNNFLFPAKQKTAQFFPFLFCFTRELNLYTPLTLTLCPPIRPYLTHRPPIHPSLRPP